jgi:hypothetical protein
VLFGERCVTVRSNIHHRTGTICVAVARQAGKARGQVVFTSGSGRLNRVSVQVLRLSLGKQVVQTVKNASKPVTGGGGGFALNWWDEPVGIMQVSVYNACMTWTDGSKACTGRRWLSSHPVPA